MSHINNIFVVENRQFFTRNGQLFEIKSGLFGRTKTIYVPAEEAKRLFAIIRGEHNDEVRRQNLLSYEISRGD